MDHEELIDADAEAAVTAATSRGKSKRLAAAELGDVFGIEIDTAGPDASSAGNPSAQAGGTSTPPKAVKSTREENSRQGCSSRKRQNDQGTEEDEEVDRFTREENSQQGDSFHRRQSDQEA